MVSDGFGMEGGRCSQLAITAVQHLVGPLCFHHQLTFCFFPANTCRILNQYVRLLVLARTYQSVNSVFLSQQTSTSRAYQSRNQPANMLIIEFQNHLANIKYLPLKNVAIRNKPTHALNVTLYEQYINFFVVVELVQFCMGVPTMVGRC